MAAIPSAGLPLSASAGLSGLAIDSRTLSTLQARAVSDPRGSAREAARQLESLFMQELIKSMRTATLDSGMLDNSGSKLGTEMLDTQLAGQLSGRPGGLSEAILKQLERQMGMAPGPIPATGSANNTPRPLAARPAPTAIPQQGAAGFVQQHQDAARRAEAETGIPAAFMVSQAALETGWGRKEIRHADGSSSFNLFGIKAGAGWKGPVAEVTTTEYVDGQPRKMVARFRAYGSYAESFADYARLMQQSPRYRGVLAASRTSTVESAAAGGSVAPAVAASTATEGRRAARFAQSLQNAGYATDPAYAEKLTRVINTTLRLQRSLA